MAKSLTKSSSQPRAKSSSLRSSEKPANISYRITNIKSMTPRKPARAGSRKPRRY